MSSQVPTSGLNNNESFDALIDLLASDDVVEDPRFNRHHATGLRDGDGRLDLEKILSFFAGGRDDALNGRPVTSPSSGNSPALRDDMDGIHTVGITGVIYDVSFLRSRDSNPCLLWMRWQS